MFDTFYDLTTLDGTLKYCKSRNYFLPCGIEPKHPYRSVDKTSRGYTYIKDEIFDLTDDSNFSCVYFFLISILFKIYYINLYL